MWADVVKVGFGFATGLCLGLADDYLVNWWVERKERAYRGH